MVWQQFLIIMKQYYSIENFDSLRQDVLKITIPRELYSLMDIKQYQFIKLIQNPSYKSFLSSHKTKKRIVTEPNPALKNIQRNLNLYLQAVYYFQKPACVHGFVKCPYDADEKLSILSNAGKHVKKNYVINADIFRFFPSITADMVKAVFTNPPFLYNDNLASAITLLCIKKNWLPTGAPSSPILSNFVCLNMDLEFEKLAYDYGYTYTRYADDLSFSGENKPGIHFKEKLKQVLNKNGFQHNYKKYRVLSKHTRQTVTGLVVNEKLNVNRDYKRRLRACQHNMEIDAKNTTTPLGLEKLNNSIIAKLNFIKMVKDYH